MLGGLLDSRTVILGLSGDKLNAIGALVDVVVATHEGSDRNAILSAVVDRESKGTTGLGSGIAVPHARTTGIDRVACALGVSNDGIDFQASDGQLCHLVFLIIAPPEQATPYLKALSAVALVGRRADLVLKLEQAKSPSEILAALDEVGETT